MVIPNVVWVKEDLGVSSVGAGTPNTTGGAAIDDAAVNSGAVSVPISVQAGAAGETAYVVVKGFPSGVTFNHGTVQTDGSLLLSQGDAADLKITGLPTNQSDNDFTLSVTPYSQDVGGAAAQAGATQTVAVKVDAVADVPTLTVQSVTATEDPTTPFAIGDKITTALSDTQGSEILTLKLANLPTGSVLKSGATIISANADSTYTVNGNQISNLTVTPPTNYNGQFNLSVTAIATATPTGTNAEQTTADNVATQSASMTITINPVNDAPIGSGSGTLSNVVEDTSTSSITGRTVSALFSGNFSDSSDAQTASGGSSASTLYGVAITSNAATAAQGTWQYSNNTGASWSNISTAASNSSALVLTSTDLVRFVPTGNFNGAPGSLTTRLIETGAAAPTSGSSVNLSSSGAYGGSTIYSSATVKLNTSVTSVNDAPVVVTANASAALGTINEDTAAPTGNFVSTLFNASFSDAADSQKSVSSGNTGTNADAFHGLAITGNAATASQGVWQYSTNNGSTWVSIGSASEGAALVIKTTDKVRFLPASNFNGTPGGLSAHLIENHSGFPPNSGAIVNLSTTGATGGATIYSAGLVTLNTSITPVSDTPTMTAPTSVWMKESLGVDRTGAHDANTTGGSSISSDAGGAINNGAVDVPITVAPGAPGETAYVVISGIPAGLTFNSAGSSTGLPAGSLRFSQSEAALLKIVGLPPGDGDISMTVKSYSQDVGGAAAQLGSSQTLTVRIDAVAAVPTLTVDHQTVGGHDVISVVEDNSLAIGQQIHAALSDTDGSEILTLKLSGLPSQVSLRSGSTVFTPNADGSYTIPSDKISTLVATPSANYSGSVNLTITAVATETPAAGNNELIVSDNVATRAASLTFNVEAHADAPTLTVTGAASGVEDTPEPASKIPLSISTALTDADGSEVLAIELNNIPAGSRLFYTNANGVECELQHDASLTYADGNGVLHQITQAHASTSTQWTFMLSPTQLSGLKVEPPRYSSEDFQIKVTARTTETSNSDTALSAEKAITVKVTPVANAADITVGSPTYESDVDSAHGVAPLSISAVAHDNDLAPTTGAFGNNMGSGAAQPRSVQSEHITSYVIQGVPKGMALIDANGHTVGLVTGVSGSGASQTTTWTLTPDQLNGLHLRGVATNFSGNIPLTVQAVTIDVDPNDATLQRTHVSTTPYNVEIRPVVDAVHPSGSGAGLEDNRIQFSIGAGLTDADGSEKMVGNVVFSEIPSGVTLRLNGQILSPDAGGHYTITAEQATSGRLEVDPVAQSNQTIQFKVQTTVAEVNSQGVAITADDPSHPTSRTDVGVVSISVKGVADAPGISAANVETNAGTPATLDLHGRTTETPVGVTNDHSESIQYLITGMPAGNSSNANHILTLTSGAPTTARLFNNGDGSWTANSEALPYVQFKAAPGFDDASQTSHGTVNLQLKAVVIENDASLSNPNDVGVAIGSQDFSVVVHHVSGSGGNGGGNSGGGGGGGGGSTTLATPPTVSVVATPGVEDHDATFNLQLPSSWSGPPANTALSIRISDLPSGATLSSSVSGAVLFFPGSITTGGHSYYMVDPAHLDAITLRPPADFGGNISLNITSILTRADGAFTSNNSSGSVHFEAVADTPSISGSGSGNEDTRIHLNLSAATTDVDNSETISSITLKDLPTGATLTHADGTAWTPNASGVYTIPGNKTGDVYISPPQNFSGDLTLTATATATETSNGSSVTTSTTIHVPVEAVADQAIITMPTPPAGGALPTLISLEDQSVNLHSLGVNAELFDKDGSEILSVRVSGLPEDARIDAYNADGSLSSTVVNNGDGSFTMSAADLQTARVYLLTPHEALDTTLTFTANTLELSNSSVSTISRDFRIEFQGVANAPTLTTQTASGVEHSAAIPLSVNAAFPDLDGSETHSLTISGAPTGTVFSINGQTLTTNADGSVTITLIDDPNGQQTGVNAFTPTQLQNLSVQAPDHVNGTLNLTVSGTAIEHSVVAAGHETATSSSTLTINIAGINDAPIVLSGHEAASLTPVSEGLAAPTGDTVTHLFSSGFSDATDNQTAYGGTQADAFHGIAITGNAATATQGTWQYLNDAGNWVSVGVRDNAHALVLDSDTQVRFVPNGDYNGQPGGLTVHLIENHSGVTPPTTGTEVDLNSAAATGGSTIFSVGTMTLDTTVSAVNDAPVVLSGFATSTLTTVGEDAAPTGDTVSHLFSSGFSDATDNQTAYGGTQADAFHGIAITGNTATTAQGTWQYQNGAGNWIAIGARDNAHALVLGSNTPVRFAPAHDFNGTPGSLTVRLIENHSGITPPTTGSEVDLSNAAATGGSTIFSAGTMTLNTSVSAANDAPIVLSGHETSVLAAINEDTTAPAGDTVTHLFSGGFSDTADNQAAYGGSQADSFQGIVITGNAATAAQGVWQHSSNGVTWSDIGTPTDNHALALSASEQIRFVPTANFNGHPGGLTVHLVENHSGATPPSNGSYIDLSAPHAVGETTIFSAGTITLDTSVTAVNDAPTAALHSGASVHGLIGEHTAAIIDPQVSVTDIDSANLSQATVSISSGLHTGDALMLNGHDIGPNGEVSGTSLTVHFDTDHHTLTLSGSAPLTTYQSILSSVGITPGSEAGARTLTITATDAEGATSAPSSVSVSFSAETSGTTGNDTISASGANDARISGGNGSDVINGAAGNDWLLGGAGDDKVFGGAGNDQISGGDGNDHLIGGAGNDHLVGGAGNDTFDFGTQQGNDVVEGAVGHDMIYLTDIAHPLAGYTLIDSGLNLPETAPDAEHWILQLEHQDDKNLMHVDPNNPHAIEFDHSVNGAIVMSDGSTVHFNEISRIEWH
ncbi:serralysin [Azospirillaceae bacterium]